MQRSDEAMGHNCVADDVVLGENVKLSKFINLYGCRIGDDTKVGAFVEIQKGSSVGSSCKISSHTFVCEGVAIGSGVFIGHGVIFINDRYPAAVTDEGLLQTDEDWTVTPTEVGDRASIGSGSTVMCGVRIGKGAIVGAGSVVTKSIPPGEIWVGNPARFLRRIPEAAK